jgi:hypothetical protein
MVREGKEEDEEDEELAPLDRIYVPPPAIAQPVPVRPTPVLV